ncbi:MAG: hypothetical protein WC763_07225, partial [Candidatus Paceibacterota bacterium]
EVDKAAAEAATSPENDIPEPTQAQKEAGNYAKGHVSVQGLDIAIENPAGSVRKGVDEDGKEWETPIAHHYGQILGSGEGADGDLVDVFIGPNPESGKVFVVDQKNPKTGAFDETKSMVGFDSLEEARSGYLANYDKSGPSRIMGISEKTMPEFKEWLKGDTTKPAGTASESSGKAIVKPGASSQAEPEKAVVPGSTVEKNKSDYEQGRESRVSVADDEYRLSNVDPREMEVYRKSNPQLRKGGKSVTVYRATEGDTINPGDWVYLRKDLAEKHLESRPGAKILSQKVTIADIVTASDDVEFVYSPKSQGEPSVTLSKDYVRGYLSQYKKGTPGVSQGLDRKDGSGELVFRDETGKPVGVLAYSPAEVTDLAVAKSARRKGVASSLVDFARGRGISSFRKTPQSEEGRSFRMAYEKKRGDQSAAKTGKQPKDNLKQRKGAPSGVRQEGLDRNVGAGKQDGGAEAGRGDRPVEGGEKAKSDRETVERPVTLAEPLDLKSPENRKRVDDLRLAEIRVELLEKSRPQTGIQEDTHQAVVRVLTELAPKYKVDKITVEYTEKRMFLDPSKPEDMDHLLLAFSEEEIDAHIKAGGVFETEGTCTSGTFGEGPSSYEDEGRSHIILSRVASPTTAYHEFVHAFAVSRGVESTEFEAEEGAKAILEGREEEFFKELEAQYAEVAKRIGLVIEAMRSETDAAELPPGRAGPQYSATKSATSFFNQEDLRTLANASPLSRSLLINMPIDDFLAMARPGRDDTKSERVSRMIRDGEKFSIPHISFVNNGNVVKVDGHEGRHRARALKALGYTNIPVELLSKDGGDGGAIRWGRQGDPGGRDYKGTWPSKMVSEDGGKTIPFPISRQRAKSTFDDKTQYSILKKGPLWSQDEFIAKKSGAKIADYTPKDARTWEAIKKIAEEKGHRTDNVSPARIRTILEAIEKAPTSRELSASMWAGRAAQWWYKDDEIMFKDWFGNDAYKFFGVLAALSPNQKVDQNAVGAIKLWADYARERKRLGRDLTREEVTHVVYDNDYVGLPNRKIGAVKALMGERLGVGTEISKTPFLQETLFGREPGFVLDVWHGRQFAQVHFRSAKEGLELTPDLGDEILYAALARRMEDAASVVSTSWSAAQASAWSFDKALWDKMGVAKVPRQFSWEEGLKNVTHMDVALASNYSTAFAKFLRDGNPLVKVLTDELGVPLQKIADLRLGWDLLPERGIDPKAKIFDGAPKAVRVELEKLAKRLEGIRDEMDSLVAQEKMTARVLSGTASPLIVSLEGIHGPFAGLPWATKERLHGEMRKGPLSD